MPKVHTVDKARHDIWQNGREVVDLDTKEGRRVDRSKPANDKDVLLVEKGQTYYWWQFRGCEKSIATTYPRPSQLTRSEFLSTIYSIQEEIEDLSAGNFNEADELKTWAEEKVSELESLRDEQESRRDNMPEHLQGVGSGELLQNRATSVQEFIDKLEGVDLDDYEEADEGALRASVLSEEYGIDDEDEADEDDKATIEANEVSITDTVATLKKEHLVAWFDDKISELQNISYSGE